MSLFRPQSEKVENKFWAAEVKAEHSLIIDPGNMIVHLSQATLAFIPAVERRTDLVTLFVKTGKKKFVIGYLSAKNFPQIRLNLIFHERFKLWHNSKCFRVHFAGHFMFIPKTPQRIIPFPGDFDCGILDNILEKLPVKDLLRCMAVCKEWKSIIRSPGFIQRHLNWNRQKKEHAYLIAGSEEAKYDVKLYSTEDFRPRLNIEMDASNDTMIHGSCDGLVLMVSGGPGLRPYLNLYIGNPLTKHFFQLPKNCHTKDYCFVRCAFGFHPDLQDHLVVRLGTVVRNRFDVAGIAKIDLHVYRLKAKRWTRIQVTQEIGILYWVARLTLINGRAYWIMSAKPASHEAPPDNQQYFLVSYDNYTDQFQADKIPESLFYPPAERLIYPTEILSPSINQYKETVSLLFNDRSGVDWSVDIWILHGRIFERWQTISFPGLRLKPVGFSRNNELLLNCEQGSEEFSEWGLSVFDLDSEKVIHTEIKLDDKYGLYSNDQSSYYTETYVESLLLLTERRNWDTNVLVDNEWRKLLQEIDYGKPQVEIETNSGRRLRSLLSSDDMLVVPENVVENYKWTDDMNEWAIDNFCGK